MSLTARITALAQAVGADIKTALAHIGSRGPAHGVATTSEAGFLSATDKTKLDSMSEGASGDANAAVATHAGAADPHGLTYPITPGGHAVDITGYDLNSLYRTGFYRGYGLVHAPLDNGGWWHVLIASHDANWVKQTATAFGSGNNAGDIYERVCNAGVWTSWAKVFKQGSAIDGTPIGQTTPAAGAFTTLSASVNVGIGTASPRSKLDVAGVQNKVTGVGGDVYSGLATIGDQGYGGSLFVNTPSVNISFASGLAIDGAYPAGQNNVGKSVVNIKAVGVNFANSGYGSELAFHTSSMTTLVERMRIDSSGNLGLGVTPSAWNSSYKAVELPSGGFLAFANQYGNILSNSYLNSSSQYIYKDSGAATRYSNFQGQHQWFTAPSGTAGQPITFTQSMALSSAGLSVAGSGTFGGSVSASGLSLGGNTLALAESGVRSWQLQATGGNVRLSSGDGNGAFVGAGNGTMDLGAYDKRWRDIHASRYVVAGTPYPSASPAYHVLSGTALSVGDVILSVHTDAVGSVQFRYGGSSGSSPFIASSAVLNVGLNIYSGRSINATGTINANGADYAEHEENNGHRIIKGQIIGFDSDGMLTPYFSEANRFAVKSTEPGYTGGNTWMDSLPPRPNKPVLNDVQRRSYGESDEINPDAEVDALIEQEYQEALVAAEIEYQSELAQYERDKTAFDKAMAEAVSKVDRIAYCGKVPVNCYNASPGDYLIASSTDEDLITCYPVRDPVYSEYLRCIGRVNRILPDGRAEIAVITH